MHKGGLIYVENLSIVFTGRTSLFSYSCRTCFGYWPRIMRLWPLLAYTIPPTQVEIEQSMWDFEAFRFLFHYDEGYYPHGVSTNNQPQYTPAPIQNMGNDSAA